jgi:hypothetical protein
MNKIDGEVSAMKALLEWYITLPTWKCVIGIAGLVVPYFVIKLIGIIGVENEKNKKLIFKALFFIRCTSEIILTLVAIWASIINYQLTHILFSSLLIALLLPFLILLNHRVEDQIEFEKNNLYR